MRVAKLIMVTGENNNKFYNMTELPDGTISVEYGRVDKTKVTIHKPASQWQKLLNSKVRKGYTDITHLVAEEIVDGVVKKDIVDIPDAVVNRLFKKLQDFANKTLRANYKISSSKVTQAMVDEAQLIVNDLTNYFAGDNISIDYFNEMLLKLFHIIPRRMSNVRNYLVSDRLSGSALDEKMKSILEMEQSTLDVMAGQVVVNSKKDECGTIAMQDQRDILSILGLEVRVATDNENIKIKAMMGEDEKRFVCAYTVVNNKTEKLFNEFVDAATNKKTELFWHGSRNENWFNIISTGLLIRPSCAAHNGSMFGDGIYFADKARKSIGYTSSRGSYWAGGRDDTGYLALYSVHVGNQKEVTHHSRECYSYSHNNLKSLGYDSVFAKGGADLRNNEYIVYSSSQCTISYLVEFKA